MISTSCKDLVPMASHFNHVRILSPWQAISTHETILSHGKYSTHARIMPPTGSDFKHARILSPGQMFNSCKDHLPMASDFNPCKAHVLMAGRLRNLLGTHYRLSV